MNQGFSKFVNYALRVIFSIIAVGVVGMLGMYMFFQNSIVNIPLIAVYVCFTLLFIYALRKKIDCKIILGVIIAGGFLLRIMWCFSIKNYPASDYKTIYDSAQLFLQGNKSMFFGTSYFARFPHLIIFVMYVASVIKMFGSQSLIVLKLINVIFSTISIYMIYRIAEEIFKDKKKSMVTVFIAALFPASIIYTAVYCTENIAILFYLISVYIFVLVMNNKKNDKYLILSGLMLLIGHLFRMAAQVVICAYILYILIYFRKKVKEKAKCIVYVTASFIIPLIIVGNVLVYTGITDTKIWSGKEPAITSVLKGSNLKSAGKWNEEDAKFIENNLGDTEKLKSRSKEIIIERYTSASPFEITKFIVTKVVSQWFQGDFGGSYWAQLDTKNDDMIIDMVNKGAVWNQVFYLVIFGMTLIGLFRSREYLSNKIINLLYIIFCGYGLLFLIIESQARYGFIVSWLFVLLPATFMKNNKQPLL